MPIDQGTRVEVYEALKTAHGERVANAFMEMLPPAGVPELATKSDVALMGAEIRAEMAHLRVEFGELSGEVTDLRADLRGEISAVRGEISALGTELRGEISAVRGELRSGLSGVRGEVTDLRADLRGEISAVRGEISELRGEFGERVERALREQTTRFVGWMFAAVGITSTIVGAAARLA